MSSPDASRNISAVYEIVCAPSKKVYIGSAKNVRIRFGEHRRLLRLGKHSNPILQAAWAKYGEASFRFGVIEVVEPDNLLARESAIMVERQSADRRFGFNINPTGWSRLGRPHSAETRARMAEAKKGNRSRSGIPHTEETKANLSNIFRGRSIGEEWRQKIKEARARQVMLPETGLKISLANKGKPKPPDFGRRVAEAQAFFTADQVLELREKVAAGTSRRSLARQYGTSHTVVSRAVDGHGSFYCTL